MAGPPPPTNRTRPATRLTRPRQQPPRLPRRWYRPMILGMTLALVAAVVPRAVAETDDGGLSFSTSFDKAPDPQTGTEQLQTGTEQLRIEQPPADVALTTNDKGSDDSAVTASATPQVPNGEEHAAAPLIVANAYPQDQQQGDTATGGQRTAEQDQPEQREREQRSDVAACGSDGCSKMILGPGNLTASAPPDDDPPGGGGSKQPFGLEEVTWRLDSVQGDVEYLETVLGIPGPPSDTPDQTDPAYDRLVLDRAKQQLQDLDDQVADMPPAQRDRLAKLKGRLEVPEWWLAGQHPMSIVRPDLPRTLPAFTPSEQDSNLLHARATPMQQATTRKLPENLDEYLATQEENARYLIPLALGAPVLFKLAFKFAPELWAAAGIARSALGRLALKPQPVKVPATLIR